MATLDKTLFWVSVVSFLPAVAARGGLNLPCPDPFADPAQDFCNPLRYIASDVLTAIAFTLIVLSALIHSVSIKKWGGLFMLALVIGEYTFAIGIGARFGLHTNPQAKGVYIIEYLFVVLSPCAFIAANYVLLGRLARHLECDNYLLIRPQRITAVFIASDISTFLIQAAGGSISIAANDTKGAMTGSNVFLGGLAVQLVSFLAFTCLYLLFLYRVHKNEHHQWIKDQDKPWYNDWRALAGALFISCVGILIRSVYRTVELSQGFAGKLATTEGFFYGLDTLPLFIAIAIYVPFWPGRFIGPLGSTPSAVHDETRSNNTVTELESEKTAEKTVTA